jgi:DNA-binding HxlR family transcriptional regulator
MRFQVSMDGNIEHEEELSRLIADEYAGKILSATYKKPMSVQQISRSCNIPIAVAYRRVAKMEETGLLRCVGYEEVYRGKKVSYYQCAVHVAKVTFSDGKFIVEVDWLPETDLVHKGEVPGEKT